MATELWVWQDGTSEDDKFLGGAMGPDGSCVLAGKTAGSWDGPNAGGDDMAAVKLDAEGNELWRYQIGSAEEDVNMEVPVAINHQDGSVVLAGDLNEDFYVTKLDAEGIVEWSFEDGSTEFDGTAGIAMAENGSVICVGTTEGSWDGPNNGGLDISAFRLDANGDEIWRYQAGSEEDEFMLRVAMVDEETAAVMVGVTFGNFSGSSNGDRDMVVLKLDAASGTEIWRYQDGTSAPDKLQGVAVTEDNSIVAAGWTEGNWGGENAGLADFMALKLSSEGEELWRWQDGTAEDEFLSSVAIQADGSILLGGDTWGDWDGANAGERDFSMVALSPDGEELWRWQDGSTGDDDCDIMAAGSDRRVILAGVTDGSWGETSALGGEDFVAVMLDVPTSATPAPSTITKATSASIAPTASFPAPVLGTTSPAPTNIPSAANVARPSTTPAPMALAAALFFFMSFFSRIVHQVC